MRSGTVLVMLAGLTTIPTFAQRPADQADRVLKAADTDHDGTISLAEAKQAAAARFDRLDTDHDGLSPIFDTTS
jgi:Ca2+-binding EF-hand superfamily protein